MKRYIITCLALLCGMLINACVPQNFSPSLNPTDIINQLINLEKTTSALNNNVTYISSQAGLPSSFSEFKKRCSSMARSPEGAVKMYFDAVFCYLDPNRRTEASKMLRYIMHADAGWEKEQKYVTFTRRLKDPASHYIFKSFAAGTSPENGYSMSPENYSLVFSGSSKEADYTRIFLISSGSDSRRIVWVKQYQDGLWYVINNADTYLKVRDPVSYRPDNRHDADYDKRY